jgi:tetratricopeptide (TPR) repeat protein
MSEAVNAIELLERKVAANADDAAARYQLAVLLLDEYGRVYEPELLSRARAHLTRAVQLRPKHAPSHAALGYTYDLAEDGEEQALVCFREARRLNPRDKEYDVYVLTLLEATGREGEALAEIEAAAPRHGVDLQALRRELIAAGMLPDASTLLINGFIRARNFFRSSLADKAERIQNALEPGRARRLAAADRKRCVEDQRELQGNFDASRVPETIRTLAPWASRYGVGDDHCRPFLLKRLSKKQRAKLTCEVDENAAAIHVWLDSFGEGQMPVEAAAFMYLTIGVEEIRE